MALRRDPTRTALERNRFAAEATYRIRLIGDLIREALVDLDVLGLQKNTLAINRRKKPRSVKRDVPVSTPPPKAWQARTDADKVAEFAAWLDAQTNAGLLGIIRRDGATVTRDEWANVYIDSAYKKSIVQAQAQAAKAGIVTATAAGSAGTAATISLMTPVHANRVKLIYTRVYSDLEGISAEMEKQIRRELAAGLSEGLGPQEIARNITSRVEKIGVTRARTLARTEVIRAHAEGALTEYGNLGVAGVEVGVEFHTASDPCPVCAGLRDSLGILSVDEARGILPVHPNCLPGDTLVTAKGVTAASKRWYEGQIVVIRTASGKRFASTPNHPVLTDGGFVPAGSVNKGHNLVSCSPADGEVIGVHDHNDVPAKIEEVAQAFLGAGDVSAMEVPVSPEDFHGDGRGSKVAIIGTNRLLRGGLDSLICEHTRELTFKPRSAKQSRLASSRPLTHAVEAMRHTARSVVRGLDLALALGLRHFRPAHPLSVGLPTDGNALHAEPPNDHITGNAVFGGQRLDAGAVGVSIYDLRNWQGQSIVPRTHFDAVFPQPPTDGVEGYASFLRETFGGSAVRVFADQVVDVEMCDFSGHVFNLETVSGIYIAESIVTHNCRCTWLPANVGESEAERNIVGKRAANEDRKAVIEMAIEQARNHWKRRKAA